MVYFAYGSNMHPLRLQKRVPSAKPMGVGVLTNYVLKFHKRSVDGSAKCNAFYTGNENDVIYGILYQIENPEEKTCLDKAEGLGNGYEEIEVSVKIKKKLVKTFTYIAAPDAIDENLLPYDWYKEYVLIGAKHFDLPESYIKKIESIKAVKDPKIGRREKEFGLIKNITG